LTGADRCRSRYATSSQALASATLKRKCSAAEPQLATISERTIFTPGRRTGPPAACAYAQAVVCACQVVQTAYQQYTSSLCLSKASLSTLASRLALACTCEELASCFCSGLHLSGRHYANPRLNEQSCPQVGARNELAVGTRALLEVRVRVSAASMQPTCMSTASCLGLPRYFACGTCSCAGDKHWDIRELAGERLWLLDTQLWPGPRWACSRGVGHTGWACLY